MTIDEINAQITRLRGELAELFVAKKAMLARARQERAERPKPEPRKFQLLRLVLDDALALDRIVAQTGLTSHYAAKQIFRAASQSRDDPRAVRLWGCFTLDGIGKRAIERYLRETPPA